MESKNQLLKSLGFSDEFLKELNVEDFKNDIDTSSIPDSAFSSFNALEGDQTSLIVKKSNEPLNLFSISIAE